MSCTEKEIGTMKFLPILLNASLVFFNYSVAQQYQEVLKNIIRSKDPNLNIGISIKFPDSHDFVYTKHQDRLFTPASCTKLFTAAAALHILGPEFCFETRLLKNGDINDQVLNGNLISRPLVISVLTYRDLEELIAQIKKAGIKKIVGAVYIDTSIFEDSAAAYYGKGFCVEDIGQSW